MITVFTPSYNRAYRLPALYKSLCLQSCKDFEWIIVDDGSLDETEKLVDTFISESLINIRYVKQENGGKHRAINRGVQMSKGNLFYIVDSDDILPKNSIEIILEHFEAIKDNMDFCGVCGLKVLYNGATIGNPKYFDKLDCSPIDFRYKYKMIGDMAEVVRTDILRQFPFPEFDNEKFCPEALIWFKIGLRYRFRYFAQPIYCCEYLPDGLTSSIIKVRRNSPLASTLYYSELTYLPIPLIQKIKGAINYWRFANCRRCGHLTLFFSLVGYLPGKLMRLIDSRTVFIL